MGIPRGPQPKGQGPWPLASRTWAGSQSSAHVRKHPMGAYTQRPQSEGHGLWRQRLGPVIGHSTPCGANPTGHISSRGHNRKVIVTVSGLNGMGSRGSVNRASTSLPLKASSLCGSFSAATRKKCVARARAHLLQEREIDRQVCVFFRLLILIAI